MFQEGGDAAHLLGNVSVMHWCLIGFIVKSVRCDQICFHLLLLPVLQAPSAVLHIEKNTRTGLTRLYMRQFKTLSNKL